MKRGIQFRGQTLVDESGALAIMLHDFTAAETS